MLDHILAILLLVILPARALWRSRDKHSSSGSKATRYLTTIGIAVGLLVLLAIDWIVMGREITTLGLGVPVTTAAHIGIGITAVALLVLGVAVRRKPKPLKEDVASAQQELLPETPTEVRIFFLFAVVIGFAWEVLYRGFLLFYLTPHIGLAGAVCVASITYGAAHGYKTLIQFIGSIVAAFAFTIGYAITANLWWLVILHTALPLLSILAMKAKPSADAR